MASLPNENDLTFYSESMSWLSCSICQTVFDTSGKWPKYNRDTHVKACIKRKKQGTKRKKNSDQESYIKLDSFLSK